MTPISADFAIKLALVVGGLGLLWYASRKAGAVVSDAAAWVGETADNVIAAPVLATGDILGIPRTNRTQFEIDAANGDTWAASFSGTATEFINYLFTPKPRNTGGATGSY